MRTRSVSVMLVALVLGFSALAIPAPAVADDGYKNLPVAKANPHISREVIVSLPEVMQKSDVKIADDIRPGTLFYYPNGQLVEGQERRALELAARCHSILIGALPGGAWSGESRCQTALLGRPGLKAYYEWNTNAASEGSACLQVRGFNTSGSRTWYNAGCGTAGNVTVNWGNVAAYPAARARTYNIVFGWTGFWSGPI
ncbi:hypothetical protein ACQEVI_00800 [Promicromonospora sp. CA-289599]|uniref:hypothetical protein n=1 Tax=Promicromonospora sp. CA-289599 TaxID=3240014 RepID=UPI003D8ED0DE